MAAIEVCDRVLQAEADGDAEAWRSVTASNATVLMPMDTQPRSVWAPAPWGGDDFDGDGIASIADGMMAEAALNPAVDVSMEWVCDPMADGRVDCSVTRVDEFLRRSGLEPGPYSRIYTVEGGQIAGWEIPPVLTEDEHNEAMEQLFAQYFLYEQWVADNHADVFADIFHGSCCDAQKVNTAESIALHSELITEYLETIPVASSGDYCATYIEWIDTGEEYREQYDDPTELPEFQDYMRTAFRALAELAPSEIKADWEYYRDRYESDPTGGVSLDEEEELEARDDRIIDHAIENCPDF